MEFTVKSVDGNVEEKSRAQVEETLLKEHEENGIKVMKTILLKK